MVWFPNAGKFFAPKFRDAEMDLKTDFWYGMVKIYLVSYFKFYAEL